MSQVKQPPVVDANGDIILHGRQGLSLPIAFKSRVTGEWRNVANAPILFEAEGLFRVPLAAGAEPHERRLVLTDEQADQLFGKNTRFAIRDESGAVAEVPWSGRVKTRGFNEQPALAG